MSIDETVRSAMAKWPGPEISGSRIAVHTHCLYPSNGVVVVFVEGGFQQFQVHDDGGALDELISSGGGLRDAVRILRGVAGRQGLLVSDTGVIRSPRIGESDLTSTICLVANVSKDAATELVDRIRAPVRHNFREELERMLKMEFGEERIQKVAIVGRSNKPHKFDYVIRLREDRQLLIDAVTPEPSSISAAVVSHLDVRETKRRDLIQRIVYDDDESWAAADLSILSMGAPVVAFRFAREALKRVAA